MNYLYEAVDASGRTVLGKIDAGDELEVRRKLSQMGYRPTTVAAARAVSSGVASQTAPPGSVVVSNPRASAVPRSSARGASVQSATRSSSITLAGNAARQNTATVTQTRSNPAPRSNFLLNPVDPNASKLGGVSTRDLAFYFQQLASLVKSGMTIYTALDNLGGRTPNKNLALTAREMAEAARSGGRVSDVMAHYPRIYPDHITGMVRAGETGGFLEIALAEIAGNFEQNLALYKGMWLPRLMASQSLYLLPIIVPLMPCIFASMDFAANMMRYLRWEMVLLPLTGLLHLGIIFAAKRAKLPQYRRFRDSMSLRIPSFGNLQRVAALSAFVRMLRRLHHAGVAPIQAWECAMNTADNVVIREKLSSSYEMMNRGASFSDAFAATGLFDSQIENLVITGQHSGEIVESLDQAADHYQERVFDATARAKRSMMSMGIVTMLVLGGAAAAWFEHSYFQGMFDFVDREFSPGALPGL